MKPNFELITELQTLTRRDFPPAAAAMLQPLDSTAIVDGEWLALDANYKLARLVGAAGVGYVNDATKEGMYPNVFPVHTERGRYDTQAVGRVNVLMLGMYEAETSVYAGVIGDYAIGNRLTVGEAAAPFAAKRGLMKKTGAGVYVVGYVTKISGSRIRFVHFGTEYAA